MSLSNNPGQYADVQQVLDAALASGGGRYSLPDKKAALRWRHRAYHYRKLLAVQVFPGITPETPYDRMTLSIEGNDVVIDFVRVVGTFKGNEKPIVRPKDGLEAAAEEFAKSLEGKI